MVYYFTAGVTIVTPNDIPLSAFGLDCALAVNTTAGASSDVQVAGTVTFSSQTQGGPINRVDITQVNISGLDTGDVALTGGVGCVSVSFGIDLYFGTLTTILQDHLARSFCGAPGAKLLEPCPPAAVAQTITGPRVSIAPRVAPRRAVPARTSGDRGGPGG